MEKQDLNIVFLKNSIMSNGIDKTKKIIFDYIPLIYNMDILNIMYNNRDKGKNKENYLMFYYYTYNFLLFLEETNKNTLEVRSVIKSFNWDKRNNLFLDIRDYFNYYLSVDL